MKQYTLVGGAVLAALAAAHAAAEPQQHVELQEIIVTATPIALGRQSTAQPTGVLSGDALFTALAPTIGETVSGEPGVRSTFYGPAASRPLKARPLPDETARPPRGPSSAASAAIACRC